MTNFVKATGLDPDGELICINVDECSNPSLNDCDSLTQICVDGDDGYTCEELDDSDESFEELDSSDERLSIEVSSDNSVKLTGYKDDHFLGYSVSSAGDINDDGIDDVIIGSPKGSSGVYNYTGFAYVLFGVKDGSPMSLMDDPASSLDGTNGFAVYGKHINDRLGESVSYAGDFNGDGIDDVIIGAPGVDVVNLDGSFAGDAGEAYIIYGSANGFDGLISASNINGEIGMTIQGNFIIDEVGSSVSNAGDVNGDGIDDVIVGAPRAGDLDAFHGGEAYVIFGSLSLPGLIHVTELDGTNGFIIEGAMPRNFLGVAVSNAGDLNGDGFDDVIVGATSAVNSDGVQSGAAYVIYGSGSTFPSIVNAGLLDGFNGFAIYGTGRDRFGFSVSYAGDVNGDGLDDVVIGAPRAGLSPRFAAGDAYILYGSDTRTDDSISSAEAGVTIHGKDPFDAFGVSVSNVGDVNDDGYDDIIIGAPFGADNSLYRPHAEAYIIYGSNDMPGFINANAIHDDDTIGEIIQAVDEDFDGTNMYRISVSSAGDINGDGKIDLIIGVPNIENVDSTALEGQVLFLLG